MTTSTAGPLTGSAAVCPPFDYQDLCVSARVIARKAGRFDLYPDLVQCAAVGMLEARERFDPTRGTPFGAYARHRIAGAVYDGLCALQPVSRCMDGRHDAVPRTSPGQTRDDDLAELPAPVLTAEEALLEREQKERVHIALSRLPAGDQAVLAAVYHLDGRHESGADLARELRRSRSYASRRHREALGRLAALIREPSHE